MMPNDLSSIFKKVLRNNDDILIHHRMLENLIGGTLFKSLVSTDAVLLSDCGVLDGQSFKFSLGNLQKNYLIDSRDSEIYLDPVDEVGERLIVQHGKEFIAYMKPENISKLLMERNVFEFSDLKKYFAEDNSYVFERVINGKKIVWLIVESFTSENNEVLKKLKDMYVVTLFLVTTYRHEAVVHGFGVEVVHFPNENKFWSLDFKMFINHQNGFSSFDLIDLVKFPLVIDEINKFVFLFGKQLSNKSDSNAYKYISRLCKHAFNKEMSSEKFGELFIGQSSKTIPQNYIRFERKKLKKDIENILKDPIELKASLDGLYSLPRDGYVKCGLKKDDIFWWK